MTDNEKELVKQTLQSKGWQLIYTLLEDEFREVKKIKTDNRRYEDIAIEVMANDKNHRALQTFINRLYKLTGEQNKPKVKYI